MKHLKKFNELYDSEESKKRIPKDELKKMIARKVLYQYYSHHK